MARTFKIKAGDVLVKVSHGGLNEFEQRVCKAFSFNLMSILSAPELVRLELGLKLGQFLFELGQEIVETAKHHKE